jgi:type IV secretion system protein VirD4
MLKPPPDLSGDGILVGYSLEHERHTAPIGFVYGDGERRSGPESGFLTPILHTGGGHLLTIAPTGAGKGVSCIVPTLLRFPGPVIVIDPKGENYAVTGARRRALGQEVVLLDPMGITGSPEGGALNPLDLIDPEGSQSIDDSSMLASLLSGGVERDDPRNLFWYQRGEQLLTGLIQYVATEMEPGERNLSEVRKLLNLPGDEFIEFSRNRLAVADDPDVRQIAGTLINPAQEMIGSILGMAQNSLGFLRGDLLHRSTARSSFDLEGITDGDPLSLFLVIPPDKLQSHRNLLRVWIGTLMAALMRRRAPMRHNTLFILDEAAQLGPLEQLRQAITLLRGYGLQTWSFWQDHSQLSNLYPLDWQTMYNNCRVHQAFGFTTLQAANAISELSGFHDPLEALRLDSDEMLLSVSGDEAVIAQKPNYLTDPVFQGLYAPNPFYRESGERPPVAQRGQRRYRRPGGGAGAGAETGGETETGAGAGTAEATGDGATGDRATGDRPTGDRDRLPAGNDGTPVRERLGLDGGKAGGGDGSGDGAEGGGASAPFATLHPFGPPAGWDREEIPGLFPGGLSPLPRATPLSAGDVPQLLGVLERTRGGDRDACGTVIRVDNVPFYSRYYACEFRDPGRQPSLELCMLQGNDIRVLHGGPGEILQLNRDAGLVHAPPAAALYLQFHLHFTRGRTTPLRMVSSLEELVYWTGASLEELAPCAALVSPPRGEPGEEGVMEVTGVALHGGDLCTLRAGVTPDGQVQDIRTELLRPGVGPGVIREEAVAGSPGMEAIHGPWEVQGEVDRAALIPHLDPREREGVDAGGIVYRRVLSCYPGVDLVRLPPPSDGQPPTLLLWGGGTPWQVNLGNRAALNTRLLHIRDVDDAAACLRLYTWLRGGRDYPITILDRPSDLVALLSDAVGDPADLLDPALRSGWPRFSGEEEGEGGEAYRFRFVLLEGNKLLAMQVVLGRDGELKEAQEEQLAADLPVDPSLLSLCLTFPPLGGATP